VLVAVVVYRTWSSTLPVHMERVRWRTASSNVNVHPTTSAARVSAALKVTTGQRKDLTSELVYHVSAITELIPATLTLEPASLVPPSYTYLLT